MNSTTKSNLSVVRNHDKPFINIHLVYALFFILLFALGGVIYSKLSSKIDMLEFETTLGVSDIKGQLGYLMLSDSLKRASEKKLVVDTAKQYLDISFASDISPEYFKELRGKKNMHLWVLIEPRSFDTEAQKSILDGTSYLAYMKCTKNRNMQIVRLVDMNDMIASEELKKYYNSLLQFDIARLFLDMTFLGVEYKM